MVTYHVHSNAVPELHGPVFAEGLSRLQAPLSVAGANRGVTRACRPRKTLRHTGSTLVGIEPGPPVAYIVPALSRPRVLGPCLRVASAALLVQGRPRNPPSLTAAHFRTAAAVRFPLPLLRVYGRAREVLGP